MGNPTRPKSTRSQWRSDRRAAAREAFAASVAEHAPLSADELGERFAMSPRWAYERIAEVRSQLEGEVSGRTQVAVNGNGHSKVQGIVDPAQSLSAVVTPAQDTAPLPPVVSADAESDGVAGGHRAQRRTAGRSWLDVVITIAVAGVASAASYGHMYEVARLAGESLWIARAFPVTVDGLVMAALRRGEAGRRWLALGIAVSVAANVLAQFPEHAATVGPAVAAWPPVALYGTHRLLHGRKERSES